MTGVAEAARALDLRREEYETAERASREASRVSTAALNKLNEAQKAFDQAVAEQKKNPPWNSHWHNSKGERA